MMFCSVVTFLLSFKESDIKITYTFNLRFIVERYSYKSVSIYIMYIIQQLEKFEMNYFQLKILTSVSAHRVQCAYGKQ